MPDHLLQKEIQRRGSRLRSRYGSGENQHQFDSGRGGDDEEQRNFVHRALRISRAKIGGDEEMLEEDGRGGEIDIGQRVCVRVGVQFPTIVA